MHFYQRLRDLREDYDLKQKNIAEMLGLKQPQYARYENGTVEIPLHYMTTLARFYNVSMDYLTGLVDEPRTLYPVKGAGAARSTTVTVNGNFNNSGKINFKG